MSTAQTQSTPATAGTERNAASPLERTIRRLVRDDGVCVLTFDRAGSSANIFDLRTLTELGEELDFLECQPQFKGLVLFSGKRSIFVAGADLKALSEDAPLEQVRQFIGYGQGLMNRLAALQFPTAAAIHGAALGGGYEICLACDWRVASTERATKIGLPETQIGLLPAWGGSTRLPRLLGLPKALEVILGGKTLAAKQALKLGMVDELAPVEVLVEAAVKKIQSGKPRRPRHWFFNNAITAALVARRARREVMAKTRGHYPAVLKALDVVTRGVTQPLDVSLTLERDGILELVSGDACRNLVRVFFLQERAKKLTLPNAKRSTETKPVARTAVIGAGVMGAGIAQWLSARGLSVILRDIDAEQVGKGMAGIARLYDDGVKRHLFTPREARDGLDRISPAPTEVPLSNVDLVIEAAVETLELKEKIFKRLGELASDATMLATNTSALPVSEIAAATRHPQQVVGLHFFNPVHRMQLVEVVAARQTAPEVLARALRFVQQIGKLPVVVKDSPGFLVNRILVPYLVEAGNLFESGARLTNIDEAMLDFGMPMGPLRLLDEVGVDVALPISRRLSGCFPERLKIPELLSQMVQAGLFGRKTGEGFYVHGKSKEPQSNPLVTQFVRNQEGRTLQRAELQERMVLLMLNEAARCFEEQIVADPGDVDFAMIMGTGFAPFRGGPLRYADSLGVEKVVGAMEHLVDNGAAHFAPCTLLKQMAASGGNFYSQSRGRNEQAKNTA